MSGESMVDTFPNVYGNLNQFYMAGLMMAPMLVIELVLLGVMYRDRKRNPAIAAGSLVAVIVFWVSIRRQTAITDRQFFRSMIPHHAARYSCARKPRSVTRTSRDSARGSSQASARRSMR